MTLVTISDQDKNIYNSLVTHPLQSFEWGSFREKTGVKVLRFGIEREKKLTEVFTLTLHKIPHTPLHIGYLPKGTFPSQETLSKLHDLAGEYNTIFIQLEPNVVKTSIDKAQPGWENELRVNNCSPSFHPLFTRYTFVLDLHPTENELLTHMHHKTRYNIRLAQKKGVYVEEDNSEQGFEDYMRLTRETTSRQRFYAHSVSYHKMLWQTLPKDSDRSRLTYHLFHARFKDEKGIAHTLVSWVLFVFHDTLYYPYGASSSLHREFMASNLMAFEAIRFGQRLGLASFDMWGALGPNPDPKDPWFGFHHFKEGYGSNLTEFIGSYDLIIHPVWYNLYKIGDRTRWALLRLKK